MKAVRLTLICHALTQAQKTGRLHRADDGILPLGQQPFADLSGVPVLTAPERRACETAAWFSGPVQVEPALADCDLGRWQGLTLKQLQAEQPQAMAEWLQAPASDVHGGESFAVLCQRIAAWLGAFDRPGEWVAVTHPMVMRAALVHVLGCPMSASQRVDVLPLSRLELSFTGQWRLRLG
ncbi:MULTISPECIES: histidine phosphatase family protein [Pseudomonas]|uniref:Histidine phosphatase family protein n=1 Tax=Pseudomonas asiatica TaxID=2219225 RepID=A0A9X4HUJ3_9PSED|nr:MULTISPECIES: histidine phosphatase family protein [Pseudomonas]MEE1902388.1 histidine phosphatase family protein [Pseudomonas inefficax]MDD2106404.1 histidine phosphatase family protein [Pseudomonas asiatica]MDD2113700.1 histidine phosphatase family protein [Pseudomonas asiatica]MDV5098051.1 histidine phosphatase family protein [Pseudomonas sp. LSJ-87]MEE1909971.1 histidine phosphatase family protein [Pseudomonas inefficax]